MAQATSRTAARHKRHARIRLRVEGAAPRPRLAVFRSLNQIYAQVIDDAAGRTIAAASSLEKELRSAKGTKTERAKGRGVEDEKKTPIGVPRGAPTIPHEIVQRFGASTVLLKPASQGTGVVAGGSVRAVVEAAGIRDILSKSLGSTNQVNVVRATIEALRNLHSAEELSARRGVRLRSVISGQPSTSPAEVAADTR